MAQISAKALGVAFWIIAAGGTYV